MNTTLDCKGHPVAIGDKIRILEVTPDPDMDEDDADMFVNMVGSTCEVERIDPDGSAWVAVWWSHFDGPMLTSVALDPAQMERTP